ncbi:hypothetical protein DFH08DRAFT_808887 [Mycena albidolilacea]|uniref:Zn(2)-C6 fungal-type domain-containing protein n=1 Tax=Mycena albidolilacea TaxID=1033008 RepID=A0AAD7A2C1_9AGAR|nr:hypothetical protein DFH08DRAFT_808887 [Mycena albidolilacea]
MSRATPDQERDESPTPVPGDKGKNRQTSPERDIQEYEEREAREKQEALELAAAAEAELTPHERARLVATNRETARRMQELAVEWSRDIEETEKNIREAKQNVERVEELRAKIAAGEATADDMVEAADLLRRGESPDDDDIPDAPCDSEDQSSEYEKASKGGLKRKRKAKKPEWKKAERKPEAGTEKRRRGRKARAVQTPPPEWKMAMGECCDNCHNNGLECRVHPRYGSCWFCKSRRIKCGLLPESEKRRPNVRPQRVREYEEEFVARRRVPARASTSRRRAHEPEAARIPAGRTTRLDEVHTMSLALHRRVTNLEIDERILHPLLTLLAQAVYLGTSRENPIAEEFLRRVGALDAVADSEFHPADDIVRWLQSLPVETPHMPGDVLPEEDVEMEDAERVMASGRSSPESENEPEGKPETRKATPPDFDSLFPMPVKEETPERLVLGLTRPQYEEHMLGASLGRKEEKRAARRAQEAERLRKEKEEVAKRLEEKAELDANIAAMMARAAELALPPKPEPVEPEMPSGPLPDVDGCRLVDGTYEIIDDDDDDDEPIASGSGNQPEEEKSEDAPEMNTDA